MNRRQINTAIQTAAAQDARMFGPGWTAAELEQIANGEDTFGLAGVAMSLMSDAQELLAMGDAEGARVTINRAKFMADQIKRRHRYEGGTTKR